MANPDNNNILSNPEPENNSNVELAQDPTENTPPADNGESGNSSENQNVWLGELIKGVKTLQKFCVENTRKLLGNMASGSLLGLFFALFLSTIFTPLMFYAFNSSYPDYNFYFKPKEKPEVITPIKGKDNDTYTIVRDWISPASNAPSPQSNSDKEFRYRISSERKGDLFSIIIRDESNNSIQQNKRQLTINVKTVNDGNAEEFPWNETSNIAKINSIFEVSTEYVVLKKAAYPTSISAFISWLKDYGKDDLNLKIKNEDLQKIASAMERVLEDDWCFQNKTQLELLFARSVNGSIQFLSVLLFNAIIILLFTRYMLVLCFNPYSNSNMTDQLDEVACKKTNYFATWGMESPILKMWHSALKQKNGESEVSPAETGESIINTAKSSFAYILYLEETIPALGFCGTIQGIGRTMLNTSAVISNEVAKQQSRITEVSLDLAFAFDTTLVALLLLILAKLFITVEMRQEEKLIQEIAEDYNNQN